MKAKKRELICKVISAAKECMERIRASMPEAAFKIQVEIVDPLEKLLED